MKKLALVAIAVFVIAGCANYVWDKQAGTPDEFNKDKDACMQEAQQGVSSTYDDAYASLLSGNIATYENLFNTCMNAHGWYLERQGTRATK